MLLKNIYRIEVTNHSGLESRYFKKCLEIVKDVPFFKVMRPKNKLSIGEEIFAIEDTLKRSKSSICNK